MRIDETILQQIASIITERRKALRMTQRELAIYAGLSLRIVTKIESGRGNPTISSLIEIAKCLGLSLKFGDQELALSSASFSLGPKMTASVEVSEEQT